jgi:hypothetical protein
MGFGINREREKGGYGQALPALMEFYQMSFPKIV